MHPSPRPVPASSTRARPGALLIAAVTLGALLAGCSSATPSSVGSSAGAPPAAESAGSSAAAGQLDANGCITNFDPTVDYYPDKSEITYATNFTIDYHNSYQVLTVQQPTQGGTPVSYVLVRCGAPTPDLTGELAGDTVVTTPVSTSRLSSAARLPRCEVDPE